MYKALCQKQREINIMALIQIFMEFYMHINILFADKICVSFICKRTTIFYFNEDGSRVYYIPQKWSNKFPLRFNDFTHISLVVVK